MAKSLEDLRDAVVAHQKAARTESPAIEVDWSYGTDTQSFPSLEDIRQEMWDLGRLQPEWSDKMLHPVPDAETVDRLAFLRGVCSGKRVLNLGSASGGLHSHLAAVSASIVGVDKEPGADIQCDLDKEPDNLYRCLGHGPPFDIIVAGELIEHLTNPGRLLDSLRLLMTDRETGLIITVPNASGRTYQHHNGQLHEIVNSDHCVWFSWQTMTTLLTKCGMYINGWCWYNGKPGKAEGLIFLCRPDPKAQ